jgi:hypothetical protein
MRTRATHRRPSDLGARREPPPVVLRSPKQRLAMGALILIALASSFGAQAGPLAVWKQEFRKKYGQNAVHGPLAGPADVHAVVPLPNMFWDSPFTLTGVVGPGADTITATHRARHKIAPHAGELAPGPWWNAPAITPPPAFFAVTMAGAWGIRPHGHNDYFGHILVGAYFGPPFRLAGYAYASSGVHDPVSCAVRGAALSGHEAVPPTGSEACGAACLGIDMSDGTFVVSVSAYGIHQTELLSGQICVGQPGSEGTPIVELGPGSEWQDLDGMGVGRVIGEVAFPPEWVPMLLGGQTYVVLRTQQHPTGAIRGQLKELPQYGLPGDMNCDGHVTFADIDLFVEALAGESAWSHPGCPWFNGDCNGDDKVTFADIDAFVARIGT